MSLLSSLAKLFVVVIVIIVLGFVIKASFKGTIEDGIDGFTDGIKKGLDVFDDVFSDSSSRQELVQNKNKYLKQSFSILEVMNIKLDRIINQITEMDDKLLEMQLEIKFDNFYNTLVALQASISRFQNTVKSYSYNETVLGLEVKKYLDNYITNSYEAQIIAFLEVSAPTSKAPIDVLIDIIKKKSCGKFFELKSSTNKMIFDFYADTMVILNTGGTLITSYYELLSKIKNGNY